VKHYVGLDVALKNTQICVMDQDRKIVAETSIETHPDALAQYLLGLNLEFHRVGLETGNLAQWLYTGMASRGLPIFCVDARKIKGFLKLEKVNKNDRTDARGIAKLMLFGTEHLVHIKTDNSQRMRALLLARKSVQSNMISMELVVRGILRNFGLKMGATTRPKWEARVRELISHDAFLQSTLDPMLAAWRELRLQLAVLHKQILRITRDDPTCRILMTAPGVGPIVSLAFKSSIDIPERFTSSQTIGAFLGLTPKQNQSGETDTRGKISRAGDVSMRTLLVEAAMMVLACGKPSWLKDWALKVKARSNLFIAAIALARKLAVILHRMWMDGTEFRWDREPMAAAA
jgi:transposase